MSPQGTNLVLTTDVPDIELDILIRNALHVEANGRNRRDLLVGEFQLVKDCWRSRSRLAFAWVPRRQTACTASESARQLTCLSGRIQPQHQDAHLLGPENLPHELRYLNTHLGNGVVG